MLGLKRNTVQLVPHSQTWENAASETIDLLKSILGSTARDIQHVGSTSIPGIMAKPIIDIAVGVDDLNTVVRFIPQMEQNGFIHRAVNDNEWQIFFSCGDFSADTRTHHIHVVRYGSMEWLNYINFRNYLTRYPEQAGRYETVKQTLAARYPNDRNAYTDGKSEIITYLLRKAMIWFWLGKSAHISIDRPIGFIHRKNGHTLKYPLNYGYIPGILGGDGEELDVYLLGVNEPVSEYECRIIGAVHRRNDNEDKLIAAPDGMNFSKSDMTDAVHFQEQYYDSYIQCANEI